VHSRGRMLDRRASAELAERLAGAVKCGVASNGRIEVTAIDETSGRLPAPRSTAPAASRMTSWPAPRSGYNRSRFSKTLTAVPRARIRHNYNAPPVAKSHFLLVFVPGAIAWLTVVGWLTWLYFNPVMDWVGAQNFFVQEVGGTVVWVAWALFLAFGVGAVGMLAERVSGIPPADPTPPGKPTGKHAGWTPPKRS